MHGGKAMVRIFQRAGVDYIFFFSGDRVAAGVGSIRRVSGAGGR